MFPSGQEIDKTFCSPFGVKTADEFGTLSSYTPVAFTALTVTAEVTAHSYECGCRDIARVCAQGYRFDYVGCASYTSASDNGYVVSYAFVSESLVNGGKSEFDGNTYVVANTGRCRSGTASESVYRDDVRTASCDTAGDCRDIVYGGNFYDYGLFIFGSFFERVNELSQIFD